MGVSTHDPRPDAPPAPTPVPSGPSAGDLAVLGDYVRLLADRMGLKDWAFEVVGESPEIERALDDGRDESVAGVFGVAIDAKSRRAVILACARHHQCDHAGLDSPERRRDWVAFRLIQCHFSRATDEAMLIPTGGDRGLRRHRVLNQIDLGATRVASAWAPALPLPLVGLMHPLRGARKGDNHDEDPR